LLQPIHAAVDIVVDFADQFVQLEAENVKLRKAAKSSADQVQEANRLAAEARNENASLKEELKKLKKKMKEEEESRHKAFVEADKKEGALRKSIESLLSTISPCSSTSPFLKIFYRSNELFSMIFQILPICLSAVRASFGWILCWMLFHLMPNQATRSKIS
jgi:hypothetical protein